jgi:hypothetical protein
MSVSFPDAAETWTTSSGERVRLDADPAALLALAVAYHAAQFGLSAASESAARDLFLRLRPVSDADLTEWMDAWNRLLAAQQAQQDALTTAYVRNQLALMGTELTAGSTFVDAAALGDLEDMIDGPNWRFASSGLRREVDEAARRLGAGKGLQADRLLADRVKTLHSPVIKVRTELSVGKGIAEALDAVVPDVEGMTFNANRAAERLSMDAINWPSFKNGKAMLYRRVVTPGACGWCVMVATRLYAAESATMSIPGVKASKGDLMRGSAIWHRGCRCTWQLVTFDQANAYHNGLGKGEKPDYWSGARAAGMWEGDAPESYVDFIRGRRATPNTGEQV